MTEKKVIDNKEKTPEQVEAERQAKELADAETIVNAHKMKQAQLCKDEIEFVLKKYNCRIHMVQTQPLPEQSMMGQVVPIK